MPRAPGSAGERRGDKSPRLALKSNRPTMSPTAPPSAVSSALSSSLLMLALSSAFRLGGQGGRTIRDSPAPCSPLARLLHSQGGVSSGAAGAAAPTRACLPPQSTPLSRQSRAGHLPSPQGQWRRAQWPHPWAPERPTPGGGMGSQATGARLVGGGVAAAGGSPSKLATTLVPIACFGSWVVYMIDREPDLSRVRSACHQTRRPLTGCRSVMYTMLKPQKSSRNKCALQLQCRLK